MKKILDHPETVVTRGSTFANKANLSKEFLDTMLRDYGGTALGQQELYAEMLDEARGALWKRAVLERLRVPKELEAYRDTVIGVDPATTSKRTSAMTGIVAVSKGYDGHGYVRADASGRFQPLEWAKKAVDLFHGLEASEIVAEGNQGGEMVRQTIHTVNKDVPVRIVTARHGKQARAEPIAALYEQARFHHIGMFAALEDQMVTWEPESGDESPDRIDALVWAARRLFVGKKDPVPSSGPRVLG
jgi:phage terminase large subunit-like protein